MASSLHYSIIFLPITISMSSPLQLNSSLPLNRDQVVVGNMICGLIAKMCFVAFLSIESISVQLTLEKRANEGRRRFLRYVLHEAPLLAEKTSGNRGEYQMLPRSVHSTSALDV